MASQKLLSTVNGYENYISQNGVSEEVVEAYFAVVKTAIEFEKDMEYGLVLSGRAKQLIEELVKRLTGGTIWELEKYAQDKSLDYDLVNKYYELLKLESYDLFESFMYYMEKNRHWKKRFYQPRAKTLCIVANDLQTLEDNPTKFQGVSQPSRTGKALAYDTPVLTRNGWKKHGELTTFDEVIGIDGKFKKVLAIHNPCEMEYKVTFSDGEEIICHGNHEWRVHDRSRNKVTDIETKSMFVGYKQINGGNRYTIPIKEPLCGEYKRLKVSPYVLGAWLGDGRNGNPDICNPVEDYAIVQKILDDGYEISWETTHKITGVKYYGFKGLRKPLQEYGMCHSRRKTPKHIPDEYLTASEEQRLELLAGLLDTDGTLVKKEHRYHFSTTEPMLRDGFIALVNSFGWRTCVTSTEPSVSSSGIHGRKVCYRISFNPTKHIPCQVERKKLYEFSKVRRIGIEKIEKIPSGIVGNCITVEDGIYCVGKTMKPTHNSTIGILFLAWIAMKRPNSHSAMGGHSGILAKGFYKELLNMMTSPEYCYQELFFYWHSEYKDKAFPTDKSSEDFTITLGDRDRFATITCRGIDGTWTGAVDVSRDGYLYVDDLVRDREHSLSPARMENTFQEYLNKMVDRKNDGAKELMVGTLWNVLDPLERIRVQYENNPEYRFRKIPALNENDESNFDYEINGFSTQYYREMREKLDNAEWMAKFQQMPYVREGLLFPSDECRYFDGTLPDEECKIWAVCDPAFGGADSLSMPIVMDFGDKDKRIPAWVHKKGTQAVTVPKVVDAIAKFGVTELHIEQNSGGKLLSDSIKAEMERRDVRHCIIIPYYASTKMPKADKIKGYSDWIKENLLFLMPNSAYEGVTDGVFRYKRDEDYQAAMDELHMYTSEGKNLHDDSPDVLSQIAIISSKKRKKATIMECPF